MAGPRREGLKDQIDKANFERTTSMRGFLKIRTKDFSNLTSILAVYREDSGAVGLIIRTKNRHQKISEIDPNEISDFEKALDFEAQTFRTVKLTEWQYFNKKFPYYYKEYLFL